MDTKEARDILDSSLKIARERVTGDDPDAKERRRERLSDLIVRVIMYWDRADAEGRPSREDLTEALGDPGDKEIRDALAAW
jgi:hypothetical protein